MKITFISITAILSIFLGLVYFVTRTPYPEYAANSNKQRNNENKKETMFSGWPSDSKDSSSIGQSIDKNPLSTKVSSLQKVDADKVKKDIMNAIKLLNEGDAKSAVAILEEVLKLDPTNDVALEELGLYYLEENKDLDKAQHYLERLFEAHPKGQVALNELTYVLEETGGVERAEKFLRNQYEKNPDSYPVLSAYAHLKARAGQIDDAANLLEKAAKLSPPTSTDELEDLAYARKHQEQYDKEIDVRLEIIKRKKEILANSGSSAGAGDSSNNDHVEDIVRNEIELIKTYIADNQCDKIHAHITELKNIPNKDLVDRNYLKELEAKCQ